MVSGILSLFLVSLCVNQEKANLRQGPGLKWAITWEATRYMPLKKLSKQEGWYRVSDLDGKNHWVREDLVSTGFSCAVIKSEYANIRKGPGLNFPKTRAGKGDKYLAFRILKAQGRWIKVEDVEGDEAWIARENLWIQ